MTAAVAPRLKVLISGATGLIGRALVESLSVPSAVNHFNPQVYTLVRHEPHNERQIYWNPYEQRIDIKKLEDFDAIVHLAGESVLEACGCNRVAVAHAIASHEPASLTRGRHPLQARMWAPVTACWRSRAAGTTARSITSWRAGGAGRPSWRRPLRP